MPIRLGARPCAPTLCCARCVRCAAALLVVIGVLSPVRAQEPPDQPETVLTQGNITLELYFDSIPQGQVGLAHVFGEGVAGARARFLNRLIDFYPVEGDGYYGLLSVDMEQNARAYD